MKRHRRDFEMMTDMNLTNLLDTAFVLLIAFIMASPTMRQTNLKLDLPEVGAAAEEINKQPQFKTLRIMIQKEKDIANAPEKIYVDTGSGEIRADLTDGPMGLDTFVKAQKNLSANQKLAIDIAADKETRYDVLAQVLSILSRAEITNVNLPLMPKDVIPQPMAESAGDKKKGGTE